MKFRKKSVEIEAVQVTSDMIKAHLIYGEPLPAGVVQRDAGDPTSIPGALVVFGIDTLEGFMRVRPGDWVITGVKGERYPCKPDIFELTYKPVTE